MKDYHINVFYSDDDHAYIADISDLKCCSACGDTPEEAVRELQIAKTAWLNLKTFRRTSTDIGRALRGRNFLIVRGTASVVAL